VRRLVTLDLETVPDEALVSAVDGEPGRPYPEQLQRLVAERRARTGGRTDFLPLPYHRPVVACLLEAAADGGVIRLADALVWTAGMDQWQPAREIAALAPVLSIAPPPLPPAAAAARPAAPTAAGPASTEAPAASTESDASGTAGTAEPAVDPTAPRQEPPQ